MERLSVTFGKKFLWKFSATSHGKGVMDGVGSNVKQLVLQKTMSKGSCDKDRVVVRDAFTFANSAKKLMKNVEVICIIFSRLCCYMWYIKNICNISDQ